MKIVGMYLLASLMSWIFTGLMRSYATAKSLIDIPNERSSHLVPIPRGGGVAIVLVFLIALLLLYWSGLMSGTSLSAFMGSGAIVAATGFWDDHGHIAARWRLLAHFFAAAWGLYWLGGLPPVDFLGTVVDLGWTGQGLALFYLVWLLNLYNFMDGIDGIAGIEAVTVCLGGALLAFTGSQTTEQWQALLLLAACVSGFLIWNFPPAKIFMGDAGSGFLGIVLGFFSILACWNAPQFFWSWLILLGVFIVDATLTLFRRYVRGEKIYEAHRSHAYQHAAHLYNAHKPVSLAVGMINMVWLMPLALWVGRGGLDGFWGLLIAYVPLVMLALRFKAGTRGTN